MKLKVLSILYTVLIFHTSDAMAKYLDFYTYEPDLVQAGWTVLDSKSLSSQAFVFFSSQGKDVVLQNRVGGIISCTWRPMNEWSSEGIYYTATLLHFNEHIQPKQFTVMDHSTWTHHQRLLFGAGHWQKLTSSLRLDMGVLLNQTAWSNQDLGNTRPYGLIADKQSTKWYEFDITLTQFL